MLKEILEEVRKKEPLIHSIMNRVSINDCANLLLACGASPIMADEEGEVEEITASSAGLVLNMGMLSQRVIPAMMKAGIKGNEIGIPVILDPVGAGISSFRRETVEKMKEVIHFAVIRGNASEIRALSGNTENGKGVDAASADRVTEENVGQMVEIARKCSKKMNSVVILTGTIDVVTNQEESFLVLNGHPMMKKVTGTGCQLSALTAAYVSVCPDKPLEAALAAVCAMGVAGEKAYGRMRPEDGSGSYRMYLMDGMYQLNGEELERYARYRKWQS